jgi:hypothetical protein
MAAGEVGAWQAKCTEMWKGEVVAGGEKSWSA